MFHQRKILDRSMKMMVKNQSFIEKKMIAKNKKNMSQLDSCICMTQWHIIDFLIVL